MAARAVEAADVGTERHSRELTPQEHWAMRVLARGPQDVRHLMRKFYGLACDELSSEEVMRDMGISAEKFEELHRRGLELLRLAREEG